MPPFSPRNYIIVCFFPCIMTWLFGGWLDERNKKHSWIDFQFQFYFHLPPPLTPGFLVTAICVCILKKSNGFDGFVLVRALAEFAGWRGGGGGIECVSRFYSFDLTWLGGVYACVYVCMLVRVKKSSLTMPMLSWWKQKGKIKSVILERTSVEGGQDGFEMYQKHGRLSVQGSALDMNKLFDLEKTSRVSLRVGSVAMQC